MTASRDRAFLTPAEVHLVTRDIVASRFDPMEERQLRQHEENQTRFRSLEASNASQDERLGKIEERISSTQLDVAHLRTSNHHTNNLLQELVDASHVSEGAQRERRTWYLGIKAAAGLLGIGMLRGAYLKFKHFLGY